MSKSPSTRYVTESCVSVSPTDLRRMRMCPAWDPQVLVGEAVARHVRRTRTVAVRGLILRRPLGPVRCPARRSSPSLSRLITGRVYVPASWKVKVYINPLRSVARLPGCVFFFFFRLHPISDRCVFPVSPPTRQIHAYAMSPSRRIPVGWCVWGGVGCVWCGGVDRAVARRQGPVFPPGGPKAL